MVTIITGLICARKPVLEKNLIVNSFLGDMPTATKQAAGWEGGPAGFLVHVSKSNLNNLERALKKFMAQLGFKYGATSV